MLQHCDLPALRFVSTAICQHCDVAALHRCGMVFRRWVVLQQCLVIKDKLVGIQNCPKQILQCSFQMMTGCQFLLNRGRFFRRWLPTIAPKIKLSHNFHWFFMLLYQLTDQFSLSDLAGG